MRLHPVKSIIMGTIVTIAIFGISTLAFYGSWISRIALIAAPLIGGIIATYFTEKRIMRYGACTGIISGIIFVIFELFFGHIPQELAIIMFISLSVFFGVISGIGGLIVEITVKYRRQQFKKSYMKSKYVRGTISVVVLFTLWFVVTLLHGVPNVVTIQSSGFDPHDVTIGPGTVTWTNNDTKTHRVMSDDGLFDSGNLAPGQSYSHYFNEVREYHYHDYMNSSMKGVIELPMSTVG